MSKPILEILEKDETHAIYLLYEDLKDKTNYERAKIINRFLTSEAKVMETALENGLRELLTFLGIKYPVYSKSVLESAFITLREQHKTVNVIDRNKTAVEEQIVGVSENNMTVIIEGNRFISIAMEIKVEEFL